MPNRKRVKQVVIRMTEEEHKIFLEQVEKSNLSQTDFFIKCISNKKINVVSGLDEVISNFKKAGNNLNQISKNLNGGFFQNADKEIRAVKEELQQIRLLLHEILKRAK
ncbi:MAG: plasmid mobilization protein [Anaerotignaceae bacterium]